MRVIGSMNELLSLVPFLPSHCTGTLMRISFPNVSWKTERRTESTTPKARYTTAAAPIPTPKPSAKPMNVQDMSVPITIHHSRRIKLWADSQTASSMSSMPRNNTRADARMVGTYGRRRLAVKKSTNVKRVIKAHSNRPPWARVINTE